MFLTIINMRGHINRFLATLALFAFRFSSFWSC